MIMIAGDVAGILSFYIAGNGAEAIPDRLSPAILTGRSLNLIGGRSSAPHKVFRKSAWIHRFILTRRFPAIPQKSEILKGVQIRVAAVSVAVFALLFQRHPPLLTALNGFIYAFHAESDMMHAFPMTPEVISPDGGRLVGLNKLDLQAPKVKKCHMALRKRRRFSAVDGLRNLVFSAGDRRRYRHIRKRATCCFVASKSRTIKPI